MARISGFARFSGLALGVALFVGLGAGSSAVAAPFGALAEVRHENAMPIVDVQARRKPRRNARRNNAAAAGALIGAAIIGGAIIANSNRGRAQYYYEEPAYAPRVYRQPSRHYGGPVYYEQPYYGPQYRQQRYYDAPPSRQYRQPRQAQPRYREQPQYYQPSQRYTGGAPTVVVPRSQSTGDYVVPGGLQGGRIYNVVPGGNIRTETGN